MITDDLHNFCSGFIGHNMVIYDSRGYSGPMGVMLQSHDITMQLQGNTHPLKVVGVLSPEGDSHTIDE